MSGYIVTHWRRAYLFVRWLEGMKEDKQQTDVHYR